MNTFYRAWIYDEGDMKELLLLIAGQNLKFCLCLQQKEIRFGGKNAKYGGAEDRKESDKCVKRV